MFHRQRHEGDGVKVSLNRSRSVSLCVLGQQTLGQRPNICEACVAQGLDVLPSGRSSS